MNTDNSSSTTESAPISTADDTAAAVAEIEVGLDTLTTDNTTYPQSEQNEIENDASQICIASEASAPSSITPMPLATEATKTATETGPVKSQPNPNPPIVLRAGEDKAMLAQFLSLTSDVADAGARESISFSANDQTAVRFLRARDWNMDNAVKLYREAVKFAIEYKLGAKCRKWRELYANPETEEHRNFNKHWFVYMFGADANGLPVTVIRNGCADISGLVKAGGIEGFICNYFWRTEMIFEQSYAMGIGHLGCFEVTDLRSGGVSGWTSRAMKSMEPYKVLAKYTEILFPERIRRLHIIGAPWAFNAIWKIITPLVPKATREKISIYSGGAKQQKAWMEQLTNEMHVDSVPEVLGGGGSNDVVLTGGYLPSSKKGKK